ncbi:C-C motif chemokine 17 [Antechinus flavipes]|uniref:C-C motif chemokine 17 n=1 Tax=Antechinus flavipes TaxID=38775 RepID=UPI0022356DAE|nr:C-C motif chemokine 17 [Antechinus flavipes]
MKGLKMSLLVVLFLGIFPQHSNSARATNLGQDCCNTYVKGAIPFPKLKSWFKTSIFCRKEAIVFITVLKKNICVDPKKKWVDAAIKYLNKNNNKSNSSSEINVGLQNFSFVSTQLPNTSQLNSKTQVNLFQQTNSTQCLNSTSPTKSPIHLKN